MRPNTVPEYGSRRRARDSDDSPSKSATTGAKRRSPKAKSREQVGTSAGRLILRSKMRGGAHEKVGRFGEIEVELRDASGIVRRPQNLRFSPSNEDVGMVIAFLRDHPDPDCEPERSSEVGE